MVSKNLQKGADGIKEKLDPNQAVAAPEKIVPLVL
jgi:hypothetical protein